MNVGDPIQITITGGTTGVTLSNPNGASITIGPGGSMSVAGVIIADRNTMWEVRLGMSIDGRNIITVPKN